MTREELIEILSVLPDNAKEKLPEEEQEVLCQLSDDSMAVLYIQDNWGQMDWVDGMMETGTYDALAWMLLSEPYKAEKGD